MQKIKPLKKKCFKCGEIKEFMECESSDKTGWEPLYVCDECKQKDSSGFKEESHI
jgi:hypothetical protein